MSRPFSRYTGHDISEFLCEWEHGGCAPHLAQPHVDYGNPDFTPRRRLAVTAMHRPGTGIFVRALSGTQCADHTGSAGCRE